MLWWAGVVKGGLRVVACCLDQVGSDQSDQLDQLDQLDDLDSIRSHHSLPSNKPKQNLYSSTLDFPQLDDLMI